MFARLARTCRRSFEDLCAPRRKPVKRALRFHRLGCEPLEERTLLSLGMIEPPGMMAAEQSTAAATGTVEKWLIYYPENYGGTWHDANKGLWDGQDDSLCWAAAASNILDWSGWGPYAGYKEGAGQILDSFGYHWTDKAGNVYKGWDWWFHGDEGYTTPNSKSSYVDVPGGGGFFRGLDLSDYSKSRSVASNALTTIADYLQDGYGVALSIDNIKTGGGHAIACWGYKYNSADPSHIYGLYLTDSNDGYSIIGINRGRKLIYCPVKQRANGNWYLYDYNGVKYPTSSSDWDITLVRGLKRFDGNLEISGTKPDDGQLDRFKITREGTSVSVYEYDSAAADYVSLASLPFADVNKITLNGSWDEDFLWLDLSGGNPIPSGGLTYNGGSGTAANSLTIDGASVTTVTHTFAGAGSGTIVIDGSTVTCANLKPAAEIRDLTHAVHRVFNFGSASDNITLAESPGRTPISRVSAAGGHTVHFANPSTSLAINSGAGNDTIALTGFGADNRPAIILDGSAGDDTYKPRLLGVPLSIRDSGGRDILDFGAATQGIVVDLSLEAGQVQTVTPGNTLSLTATIGTCLGTNYADTIAGNAACNMIRGCGGDDTLYGGGGRDRLFGNAGNDRLYGGAANDRLDGGVGNDILYGDSGNELLLGSAGNDTLYGGTGDDKLNGGPGNDGLYGEAGKDILVGGGGSDHYSELRSALALGEPVSLRESAAVGSGIDREAHAAALRLLLVEWSRLDAATEVRVANLSQATVVKRLRAISPAGAATGEGGAHDRLRVWEESDWLLPFDGAPLG